MLRCPLESDTRPGTTSASPSYLDITFNDPQPPRERSEARFQPIFEIPIGIQPGLRSMLAIEQRIAKFVERNAINLRGRRELVIGCSFRRTVRAGFRYLDSESRSGVTSTSWLSFRVIFNLMNPEIGF